MRKLPPLNAIRIFEAAARNMSFTAAAQELSITTAAVSHQIRHLEDLLSIKLFERTSRNVKLSPVGERLLPLLTEGLDRLSDAFSELEERRSASVVSVTTTRSFSERWLLPRLPYFKASQPNVIVHLDASDTVVDLRAGGADIAIRYGRNDDSGLGPVELFTDHYIAVCHSSICDSPGNPKLTDLQSKHLLASRWINQALGPPDWTQWLRLAGIDKSQFQISWFSEEGLAIQAMERGFGALLCSDALVFDQLRAGTCQRIDGPTLEGLRYRLLTSPSSSRKAGVRLFTNWLRQEASNFLNAKAGNCP